MPIHECSENGRPGYQWGSATCYTYEPGDEAGRKEAKRKAIVQGYAAERAGAKEAGNPTMTDLHIPATRQKPVVKSADEVLSSLPEEILLRPALVSARKLTSTVALRARAFPSTRLRASLQKVANEVGAAPWVRLITRPLSNELGLYDLVLRKRPLNGHTPTAKASAEEPFRVLKADAVQQLVTGVVFEPEVVDSQDDFVKAPEIEAACHQFLADYRAGKTRLNLAHDRDLGDEDALLVENWVTPQAMSIGGNRVKQGAWVQTWHILNTALWKAIEDGTLTGFSFGGSGERKDDPKKAQADAPTQPIEVRVLVDRPREAFEFDIVRDAEGRAQGFRGTAQRNVSVAKDGRKVIVTEEATT